MVFSNFNTNQSTEPGHSRAVGVRVQVPRRSYRDASGTRPYITLQGSCRVVLRCKPGSSEELTPWCLEALAHEPISGTLRGGIKPLALAPQLPLADTVVRIGPPVGSTYAMICISVKGAVEL